jgi:hypothetical protein
MNTLSITISELRTNRACGLDGRIAALSAHLGRTPGADEPIPLAKWAEVTPEVDDLVWALRCCWYRGGRSVGAEVARRAAARAADAADAADASNAANAAARAADAARAVAVYVAADTAATAAQRATRAACAAAGAVADAYAYAAERAERAAQRADLLGLLVFHGDAVVE